MYICPMGREIRVRSLAGVEPIETTLDNFLLCTDVVDVNGDDIWEGDKVSFCCGVGEVVWVDTIGAFKIQWTHQHNSSVIVDYFDLFPRQVEIVKDGLQ